MMFRACALGLLVLGWAAAAGAETVREQSSRSVELPGISTVIVQNSRGSIELRPSPDGQLHLKALKTVKASSASVARRLAGETQVELHREGGRYKIRVRYPQGTSVHVNLWEGFNENTVPRSEMLLAVQVPSGVAVELNAASADLGSAGVSNSQRLETASGDIVVESPGGPVTIETASGDIHVSGGRKLEVQSVSGDVRIQDVTGFLSVGTTSGDVRVDGAGDSIRIETVSGDIVVERAPRGAWVSTASGEIELNHVAGRLFAESVSADIRATLAAPVRETRIESSSGDVKLGLASNAACLVEMRTSSGELQVDVPSQTRNVSRRRVTAVVRGGTTPVTIETVSGSILVTRGGP